jgi:hypothetical protein
MVRCSLKWFQCCGPYLGSKTNTSRIAVTTAKPGLAVNMRSNSPPEVMAPTRRLPTNTSPASATRLLLPECMSSCGWQVAAKDVYEDLDGGKVVA